MDLLQSDYNIAEDMISKCKLIASSLGTLSDEMLLSTPDTGYIYQDELISIYSTTENIEVTRNRTLTLVILVNACTVTKYSPEMVYLENHINTLIEKISK